MSGGHNEVPQVGHRLSTKKMRIITGLRGKIDMYAYIFDI